MAEAFWSTKFRDREVHVALNDLSNQRLREMKAKFGSEYGIPTEFINLLLRGDMDAIECALWIGHQKAGGEVPELGTMDFTLDDFEPVKETKAKKPAGKEKPTPAVTTTADSVETPS